MAGVNIESGGKGGRRSLDSEINMIPMIDLLMVTISFLLITAVWVHSQRLTADAQVPGNPPATPPCEGNDCKEDPKLHVQTADPAKFTLVWKQGSTVIRTVDVPREAKRHDKGGGVSYPGLADKIGSEWHASGLHREASDRKLDRAVVHAPNDMPYSELIAVMDAVSQQKRSYAVGSAIAQASAFDVTFAAD
jgi:biopolymer transport protein ExbD